uniref:Large ribosomal subunit protein P1 n=1 Tax=Vombatus ursinus TaxID=29139 RepID=A0A4X2LZ21_VOMUR
MAFSELTWIYSALILLNDEVTVTEDKINALIKAAGINVEPLWPELFEKALSSVNISSLICHVGVGGPAPAGGGAAPAGAASPAQLPQLRRRRKRKQKKESKESDDDMGLGLFDLIFFVTLNKKQLKKKYLPIAKLYLTNSRFKCYIY